VVSDTVPSTEGSSSSSNRFSSSSSGSGSTSIVNVTIVNTLNQSNATLSRCTVANSASEAATINVGGSGNSGAVRFFHCIYVCFNLQHCSLQLKPPRFHYRLPKLTVFRSYFLYIYHCLTHCQSTVTCNMYLSYHLCKHGSWRYCVMSTINRQLDSNLD